MSALDPRISSNGLTAIISRLEAATSRLEDIASSTIPPPSDAPKSNGISTPTQQAITTPPPPTSVQAPALKKIIEDSVPECVAEFDSFIQGAVKKYVNLSDEIGGVVAEQVSALHITSFPKSLPWYWPRRVTKASLD